MRQQNAHPAIATCFALALALAPALLLAGCASGNSHQVISSGQACESCHSEKKQTYEVSEPNVAAYASDEIIVKTSADKLDICAVTFISEDGSRYVPTSRSTVKVENGEAVVAPGEGIWAVCIDNGGSSTSMLIRIDSAAPEQTATADL